MSESDADDDCRFMKEETRRGTAELIARFGREWFDAQVHALGYVNDDHHVDVQTISEIAGRAPISESERTDLLFDLLRIVPSYGMLMLWDVPQHRDERSYFWQVLRNELDSEDDSSTEAIMYWLWVDWFEGSDRVAEAWREATSMPHTERRVASVVESSGPVPWDLKAPLLRGLVADSKWHLPVFSALRGALFDVYGSINRDEAASLLAQLSLVDEEVPGLRSTRMAIDRLPSGSRNWMEFLTSGPSDTWFEWGADGELHERPGPDPRIQFG